MPHQTGEGELVMNPKEGRLHPMLLPGWTLYDRRSFPRGTDERMWNRHEQLFDHLDRLRYTARSCPLSMLS